MTKAWILAVLFFIMRVNGVAQTGQILRLQNCQSENRITTYNQQANVFVQLVGGWTTLKDQKWIKFAPDYVVDTLSIEKQIESIRRSLPVNYFKSQNLMGETYNNIPDEKATVWFTLVFSNAGRPKNLKIYSAIKLLFTGDDAREQNQRSNPKIKNIRFITDPKELESIKKRLTHQAQL